MKRFVRVFAPLAGLIGSVAGLAVLIWRKVLAPQRSRPLDAGQRLERPVAIPREAQGGGLQLPADGVGPLYHRVYRADIADAERSPEEIMREVQLNLSDFSPDALAKFAPANDKLRFANEEIVTRDLPKWSERWNAAVQD